MVDVIIVGAGPSGAILAHLLSQKHRSVLLLEKDFLPRKKPCGGGLPFRARQALPFDVSPVIDQEAQGGYLEYRTKTFLEFQFKENVSSLVRREVFDTFLTNQARAAGAEVREGFKVSALQQRPDRIVVTGPAGSFAGSIAVGADGVNSLVARQAGLLSERKTGAAISAEIHVPQRTFDKMGASAIFDFGAVPHGYAWIFPKNDHLNAGVFTASPSRGKGLKSTFARYLQSHPLLRDGQVVYERGHRIPLGGSSQPLHSHRTLLVGDAANLADPFLGEGLYYSIRSAQIAAEEIDRALDDQISGLSDYSQKIHAEIIPQFRHATYLANLVYSLPKTCTRILSRSPFLQKSIVQLLRGEMGYREMNRLFFRKIPNITVEVIRIHKNGLL